MTRKIALVVIGFILILGFIWIIGIPSQQQYEVVIRYTERYADQIGYDKPDEGYTYLIVTLDIENKIDRKFKTSPSFFNVIVNGVEYSHWGTPYLDDELKPVELHRGGRISGSIAFEVPEGTTEYELTYWSVEPIRIQWIHY